MLSPPIEVIVEKARGVIARILAEPSELLELWRDSDDHAEWRREVEELSKRPWHMAAASDGANILMMPRV